MPETKKYIDQAGVKKIHDLVQADIATAVAPLDDKVDKVAGKGLSTEDFTTGEKSKLEGIEQGAQVNVVTSVAGKVGDVTLNKADVGLGNVDNTSDADKPISTAMQTALAGKVDVISGKGLSTNDYTNAEKQKLAGIEAGAQVNAVVSVAGRTGAVTLTKDDVGLDKVINTGDSAIPAEGGSSKFTTGGAYALKASIDAHTANESNPHDVTKVQVGLSDVLNTADTASPIEGSALKFTSGGAYSLKTTLEAKIGNVATEVDIEALFD